MNICRIAAFAWGLFLIITSNTIVMMPSALAKPIGTIIAAIPVIQRDVKFTPQQQSIITELQTAKVVYLGEIHDRESEHQQQLAIIQALFARNSKVAIGMEMFQRPAQGLLDRYLAGKITSAELRAQTEFDRRWGYKWEYYEPILNFAKINHLPVIALNTPTEITRKVAKEGLDSLTRTELQYIPPLAEIDRSNAKYRESILASYQQHTSITPTVSKSFDRFYNAQLLWDETMADAIANFAKKDPNYQTIVLAGRSHIIYGYGIPDRVHRRLGANLNQKTVILSDDGEDFLEQPADFFWDIYRK